MSPARVESPASDAQRVDTPVGPQLRSYVAAGHRPPLGTNPRIRLGSAPALVIAPHLSAEPSSSKSTHTPI